ncbi:MAG: PQQ-binding-like beta-propeller repeat protein, partial [Rubripirellula sp.]|nr:PQQ-binding-like beta-propeller repeat protein [Rubripirellula sp.]
QRTGYREQTLHASSWQPAWVHQDLDEPAPAWSEPAKGSLWQELRSIEPRVVDDRGDVPLIALDATGNQHLLVTSSSTDRLVSLNPMTGELRWQFVADGPIRYAPHIEDGMVWLGSDDGVLRALDLISGKVQWSRRIGPEQPKIFGNGRLIDSHPIRTSTIVSADLVFATAGLFPSQGVYAAAFNKLNGELVWRRKVNRSPQGYLLTDHRQRLCIPCGRSAPFCLALDSGRFINDLPSPGGSFCMLTREAFFSGPGNTPSVQSFPNIPEAKMLPIAGRAIAAGNGRVWFSNENDLKCHDLKKMTARVNGSEIWSAPCEQTDHLIVTGDAENSSVFATCGAVVTQFNGRTGTRMCDLNLPSNEGVVRYLAVSDSVNGEFPELLVATTSLGRVFAWHGITSITAGPPTPVSWQINREPSSELPKTEVKDPNAVILARIKACVDTLQSQNGLALVVNDLDGRCANFLATQTRLNVISLVPTTEICDQLRNKFLRERRYGERLTVMQHTAGDPVPFAEPVFNLAFEVSPSEYGRDELIACVTPGSGIVCCAPDSPFIRKPLPGVGVWRHQYGSPTNTSDSGDSIVGQASEFRLQWFGGVGPARMPDRHLRAQSPLAAASSLILHGDESLIGVDPANGTERWEIPLPPDAVRYVMPFDGGYSSLTPSGDLLYTAVGREIWKLNALTGERLASFLMPAGDDDLYWGYVAEQNGLIIASAMKPGAGRLKGEPHGPEETVRNSFPPKTLRERYTKQDYDSARPLVCSRALHSLDPEGRTIWKYAEQSVIANSSISIDGSGERIVFIESRSDTSLQSDTDRISAVELSKDSQVVCLDAVTGQTVWVQPLPFPRAVNILYTQIFDDVVILATSESGEKRASYQLATLNLQNGSLIWSDEHTHITDGLGHGEQVHHPLTLRQPSGKGTLIAEPYLYDLTTGEKITPAGDVAAWSLSRPGHSCGTLSGAGQCVFFRAGNPTVLNLAADQENAFQKLSPSRPGCWINMLPAGGRLLIPEGSASCVCSFPVQTSMGFSPVTADQPSIRMLEDFPPLTEQPLQEMYAWQFKSAAMKGQAIQPKVGDLPMIATQPIEFTDSGILLDGKQWLAISPDQPDLPIMPATLSLETRVEVSKTAIEWSGIIGAIQDNGDFERGALLGIHNDHFFFAIASEQKSKLTYLEVPQTLTSGQPYHLVGTFDGKNMKLFVDGKLVGISSAQSGAVLFEQASWLSAGIYKDDNDHLPFTGILSEAAIFRGALTPDAIRRRAKESR